MTSVTTGQRLLTGMQQGNCPPGQARLWELKTSFPAIDPVFWLHLLAKAELKALGCHFLGKAGAEPLPLSADMVRYKGPDGVMVFRKDAVQKGCGDQSSSPMVFMGSVTASKGFRAETSLQQLQLRIQQTRPDILLLDVSVQGLKPEEVCQVLKENNAALTTWAWLPFAFEAFGLPSKESRYLWVAGREEAKDQTLVVKVWDGCKAWAKAHMAVQADLCLLPPGLGREFLVAMQRRGSQKRKPEAEPAAASHGEVPGASPEEADGESSKRRKKNTVEDFAKGAVEAGLLSTEAPTLPTKFQASYAELPRASPLTFVHAAALVQRSEDGFKSHGKRPFLLTDASLSNWKRVAIYQAALPTMRTSSVILAVHGESLREILSEECLAMLGFDLQTVQLNFFTPTAAKQAVVETLPVAVAAAMIVLAASLCSLWKFEHVRRNQEKKGSFLSTVHLFKNICRARKNCACIKTLFWKHFPYAGDRAVACISRGFFCAEGSKAVACIRWSFCKADVAQWKNLALCRRPRGRLHKEYGK